MRYKLFFSPTGGVKRCLDLLIEDGIEIDLSKKDFNGGLSFSSDDVVYIALPSFGGRCPSLAIKRLLSFSSNGARAVLIAVYGNRDYEDTLIELFDIAKEMGFKIAAAAALVAEHSMVREIAKGRPDETDEKKIKEFALAIKERLNEKGELKTVPGHRPYKEIGKFLNPKASDLCIRCGKCFYSCPANAIDELSPNLSDSTKCIGCARCIKICPLSAREYEKDVFESIKNRLGSLAKERKEAEIFL